MENKLCPFRKTSYSIDSQNAMIVPTNEAYGFDEDFKPCVLDKCMAYRDGDCGLCHKRGEESAPDINVGGKTERSGGL